MYHAYGKHKKFVGPVQNVQVSVERISVYEVFGNLVDHGLQILNDFILSAMLLHQ